MSDREWFSKAFGAMHEAELKAPLSRADFLALEETIRDYASKCANPEALWEMVGEGLAWLEPGGEFESPELARS
jgi:hypothetical protein